MIDLHMHSTISDGSLSPTDLIKRSKSKKIDTLALTDHDSILELEEAEAECKRQDINFITGVELEASTDISKSRNIHILAYNFTNILPMKNYLRQLKQERIDLIYEYIDIMKQNGINTSF